MGTAGKTRTNSAQTGELRTKLENATNTATESLQEYGSHYVAEPARDIFRLFSDYAKDRPEVAAVWCFGLGLLVGWKLRG